VPSLIDTFLEYDAEVEQCVCPAGLPTGVQCTAPSAHVQRLETRYNVNLQQVNEVVYYNPGNGRDSQAFNSALMADSLPDAAWACSETADRQACNMVANLCVLNHYDPDRCVRQPTDCVVTTAARALLWTAFILSFRRGTMGDSASRASLVRHKVSSDLTGNDPVVVLVHP